ncbi:hypothetical protein B0H15DRAFT_371764 [Mycena belliarum]|uniref:F-box domain-containing protein n=1 Tax=Mycena belliarum TaxID=1033014 RepID=A0AAD6U5W1_9AGAR|nr:hypothetical protein B0H15DRAFT_371764 [Mycena belliae]
MVSGPHVDTDTQSSSTQRLPPEILMQVFSECCSKQYDIQASPPVVLSQVSWEWRSLALSMPVLWASFSLRLIWPNTDIRKLLRLHLERSADCALSFDMDFNEAVSLPVLRLVSMLAEHSDRWAVVKLPFSAPSIPLFSQLNSRFRRLESLELKLATLNQDEAGNCAFFEVAPRLRRLVLGANISRGIPFPKDQITELHLGAAPTLDILQFMARCPCPHLTRLILNPHYPLKYPHNLPQSLPPFMHLRTLTLAIRDGYSRNQITEVLDLLTAPVLQTLEVIGVREIRIPPRAFASFLERSGCSLQTLIISFKDNLPVPTLLINLRALPSLTRFVVMAHGQEAMQAVGLILQSLNLSDSSNTHMLPIMTSFELQTARFHPALLDMVESRLPPHSDSSASKR